MFEDQNQIFEEVESGMTPVWLEWKLAATQAFADKIKDLVVDFLTTLIFP